MCRRSLFEWPLQSTLARYHVVGVASILHSMSNDGILKASAFIEVHHGRSLSEGVSVFSRACITDDLFLQGFESNSKAYIGDDVASDGYDGVSTEYIVDDLFSEGVVEVPRACITDDLFSVVFSKIRWAGSRLIGLPKVMTALESLHRGRSLIRRSR